MMIRFRFLTACCLLLSIAAHAEIYKWVDADGKTHFGDHKPSTKSVETLNLPTSTESSTAPANNDDYKERQRKLLEAMRSEREAKEAAEQKQAKEQAQQQKNCVAMKDYLRNISNGRIYDLNSKGERVYASDAEREKEIKNVQNAISTSCR